MIPDAPIGGYAPSGYSIRIHDVVGGEATNMWTGSKISSETFLEVLARTIDQDGYFALVGPTDPSDFILGVRIIDQRQPLMGIAMTVGLSVDYGLFDAAETLLYQDVIDRDYTAKFSDAFIGTTRLNMANEGAVRVNIRAALEILYALELSR